MSTTNVEDGPVFRASEAVVARIEFLLAKQREEVLSDEEEDELDSYEAIDDGLSLVNRVLRGVNSETQDDE